MTWEMVGMIFITLFKILGILLLLLLFLAVLVLLVPVRYRVLTVFETENRKVCGKFSWLGFVVRLLFRWEEDRLHWRLRIFGIPVCNGDRVTEEPSEDSSFIPDQEQEVPIESEEKENKPSEDAQNKKKPVHRESTGAKNNNNPKGKKATDTIPGRIRGLVNRIKRLFRLVKHKIHSIQDLVRLLQEDYTKRFICIAKDNMLHLWKQLRPRKIYGELRFGTGDPCSTGQILGLIAVFYGWIGSGVKITPDFHDSCFEGRLVIKGRIRMITMVVTAVKIMFHKDFKKLQREWERWKEDF